MKFVAGENGRYTEKNSTQSPFRPSRNPHESQRRELAISAVGGEHLNSYATEPPKISIGVNIKYIN